MKIATICSSLELGRDGVGDYSRYLARECIRQGHSQSIVALNDRHCSQKIASDLRAEQEEPGISVPTLRLPSTDSWKNRTQEAIAFLQKADPEWLSLQFVSYGFNNKGIIAQQIQYFRTLRQSLPNARTHIMLHELWIVETPTLPLKQRLVAALQKYFVRSLLKSWAPDVINTSTDFYRQRMVAAGYPSIKVLPLFGNVPVIENPEKAWIYSRIQSTGVSTFTESLRKDYLICGFFGTLRPPWSPEPLMSYLFDAADRMGKKLMLLSAGRIGAKGQAIWDDLQARYGDKLVLFNIGELPAEQISEYLRFLDIGIAASTKKDIGKSGTAAAMLDHGVPIIINRLDDSVLTPWDDRSRTLLHLMEANLPEKIVAGLPHLTPDASLKTVTRQFLQSLGA